MQKQKRYESLCMLIWDLYKFQPSSPQASAAMDVRVGYYCDPEKTQGLAHFLGMHDKWSCWISNEWQCFTYLWHLLRITWKLHDVAPSALSTWNTGTWKVSTPGNDNLLTMFLFHFGTWVTTINSMPRHVIHWCTQATDILHLAMFLFHLTMFLYHLKPFRSTLLDNV